MNTRTLIAGLVVLVIGAVLGLVGAQLVSSIIREHPHGLPPNQLLSWDMAWASTIVGYLFGISGFILILYGAISPDRVQRALTERVELNV